MILQAEYDSAGLDRYTSPGAGASTPWFNRSSTAARDIEAGSELFVDYGTSEASSYPRRRFLAQPPKTHAFFSDVYNVAMPLPPPPLLPGPCRLVSIAGRNIQPGSVDG